MDVFLYTKLVLTDYEDNKKNKDEYDGIPPCRNYSIVAWFSTNLLKYNNKCKPKVKYRKKNKTVN